MRSLFKYSKSQVFVLASFCAFPLYFLYPALITKTNIQMGQPYFGTFKATDIAGSIRNAWVLKSMTFPWSYQYVTNWPEGEFFWRWQNFTQFFQLIYTWFFVKFAHPSTVVASIVFIGWVFTALVIYQICRQIGVPQELAIMSGVFWQLSPWTRSKAVTETSFMFMGLLLLCILIASKQSISNREKIVRIVFLHSFTLFFDAYLFFMLLLIDLCLVVFYLVRNYGYEEKQIKYLRSKKITTIRKLSVRKLSLVFSGLFASYLLLTSFLRGGIIGSSNGYSRPLSITPKGEIQQWLGSPLDYLNPMPGSLMESLYSIRRHSPMGKEFAPNLINYSGFFITVLGLIGFYLMWKNKSNGPLLAFTPVIFIVFFLTSTYITVRIPTTDSILGPLAVVLANIMPGVRIFTRFGLLAQALLCISAAYAIWKFKSKRPHIVLIPMLAVLIVLDFNPLAGRGVSEETNKFLKFNQQIQLTSEESLLQLPLNGRAWMDHAFLFKDINSIRTVNSLYSASQSELINSAINSGVEDFSGVLKKLGVRYIIIVANSPKPYDMSGIDRYLQDSRFTFMSETNVSGSESDYSANLHLYRFNP